MNHRQGGLSFAQIVAYPLADFMGSPS